MDITPLWLVTHPPMCHPLTCYRPLWLVTPHGCYPRPSAVHNGRQISTVFSCSIGNSRNFIPFNFSKTQVSKSLSLRLNWTERKWGSPTTKARGPGNHGRVKNTRWLLWDFCEHNHCGVEEIAFDRGLCLRIPIVSVGTWLKGEES